MAWSLLVLGMHEAETVKALYILRFFKGFFESGAMPGSFYIIGSWYRKSEISRRTTLFWFSSVGGQMLCGYIQAGLYRNMNGRLGLAAWRWLFILDFLISPPSRHSWPYLLPWFMELTCGVNLQRWMTLWIKSLRVDGKPRYSTEKVNAIPTAVGCTCIQRAVPSDICLVELQLRWEEATSGLNYGTDDLDWVFSLRYAYLPWSPFEHISIARLAAWNALNEFNEDPREEPEASDRVIVGLWLSKRGLPDLLSQGISVISEYKVFSSPLIRLDALEISFLL
ncbi:major facilitator superfamily transporter [Fusarium denticulatum]|uniref:Major facilitator superfamily transporter n=1 Tax=Fusarium denticulatum TaxID=48507 RepID=A0A8H5X6V1_9HYPO|nr:major facilitator superfamily transporter [Fusarium denticulatum]